MGGVVVFDRGDSGRQAALEGATSAEVALYHGARCGLARLGRGPLEGCLCVGAVPASVDDLRRVSGLVRRADVERAIEGLRRRGLVARRTVDGVSYWYITGFGAEQRRAGGLRRPGVGNKGLKADFLHGAAVDPAAGAGSRSAGVENKGLKGDFLHDGSGVLVQVTQRSRRPVVENKGLKGDFLHDDCTASPVDELCISGGLPVDNCGKSVDNSGSADFGDVDNFEGGRAGRVLETQDLGGKNCTGTAFASGARANVNGRSSTANGRPVCPPPPVRGVNGTANGTAGETAGPADEAGTGAPNRGALGGGVERLTERVEGVRPLCEGAGVGGGGQTGLRGRWIAAALDGLEELTGDRHSRRYWGQCVALVGSVPGGRERVERLVAELRRRVGLRSGPDVIQSPGRWVSWGLARILAEFGLMPPSRKNRAKTV